MRDKQTSRLVAMDSAAHVDLRPCSKCRCLRLLSEKGDRKSFEHWYIDHALLISDDTVYYDDTPLSPWPPISLS